jgi:hypothetical protein
MNQKLKEFFSSALSSRSLQSQILGPVLKQMNSQIDMRPHVLRAVSTVATSVFLNASCKFISEKTSKRGKEYKFVIRQLSGCEDRNSALNIESSFVFLAMILPVTFLLPPFSQYRIDYHEQQVEDLLWENDESYSENGKLYLNGQVYGVQKTLWECAKQNIANQVSVADPEQWKVNVVEKDYLCPIRKRVVLKRGEVYGAPYSVVSIWDTSQQSSIGRYDAIIQDEKSSCIWTQLEKKQEELLKMFNKTINIVYDKSVEIVVINNASVVGGVQAKIFSAMLKLYIDKKRNIFEWRDLAAHDELICDPYSTGLSTRLSRLIETLQKINCGCIIKKITRGKYTLISDYHIRYSEKT